MTHEIITFFNHAENLVTIHSSQKVAPQYGHVVKPSTVIIPVCSRNMQVSLHGLPLEKGPAGSFMCG